ncbi:hypothetical protein G4B88_004790 [Cannabis sativa]|uniref:Knottins-like domain-containing protein n=1 Tax=Cannabis sativa TaxID=3483 RepID=A0A7J6DU61_CANSA|nr:hypothetical protein G4B88_029068 [Cannabis sativa]KAF4375039.1 hypothetical protein G4B88_004790 [Cannabis sativa]
MHDMAASSYDIISIKHQTMDRKGSFGFGSRVVFFWLFLVFILLASSSKMGSVEGRMCESQSHHYEGACVIDHNCATDSQVANARAFVAAVSAPDNANYEVVEGRVCESRSQRFFGKCTTDSGCTSTCRTEGFAGGRCTGLRQEVVVGVEGRVCESRSTHFLGKCMSDSGCTNSCRSQGFAGGACKGLRRRCFCSKLC